MQVFARHALLARGWAEDVRLTIERGQGKTLEAVRAEIHQKLYGEVVDKKFISWLEELRSQSHIKIIN